MSTNDKNIIRKAYMRNFTTKIKHRYILTEKNSDIDTYIQNNLRAINESIYEHIQNLSIRVLDRQIPYIVIEKIPISLSNLGCDDVDSMSRTKRIRGLVRDIKTEPGLIERLAEDFPKKETKVSHSIEFFAHTMYNELTFSNNGFDAKLLLNDSVLATVFTDVFLDSAMFNSYSFLKELDENEKQEIGAKKLEFYKNKGLPCFYRLDCEDEGGLLYYSLAFSCRENVDGFDYEKYIALWEEFVKEYFPNEKHKEKSVLEQLKQHRDFRQLPKGLSEKIMKKMPGAYLVLRVNRDRTEGLHERINNYFGTDEYSIGEVKIVKISEYYKIEDMLKHLDVSAYKVIRPEKKKGKK